MTDKTINWEDVLEKYDVMPDELQIRWIKEEPEQYFRYGHRNIYEDFEGFADMFDFDSVETELLIEYLRETRSNFQDVLIDFILGGDGSTRVSRATGKEQSFSHEECLYMFIKESNDWYFDDSYLTMQYEHVYNKAPIIADYKCEYFLCGLEHEHKLLENHPEVTGEPYPENWVDNWLSKYLPSRTLFPNKRIPLNEEMI